MTSNGNGLFLAVELDGLGESPRQLRESVAAAESAGFAIVTFGDALAPESSASGSGASGPSALGAGDENRIDAGTRAAFVASVTTTIGLAPTVHTLTTEPFFLATQLASLDHASHGRGAWVVGADNHAQAHEAVGTAVREHDSITQEVRDVIEVSRRLWDSWEDDAVIRDASTGRYLDPDKVHHVRFEGEFFDVVGPLITPRSPQGQIVVIGDAALGVTDLLDIVLVDEAEDAGEALVFVNSSVSEDVSKLAGTVAGVRFQPTSAEELRVLLKETAPALAAAGLLRRPTAGLSLRENLGLDRPVSRYAAAKN